MAGAIKVRERSGNRLTLDNELGTFVVDTDTRTVLTVSRQNGRTANQVDQFGFAEYEVGNAKIRFPSVHIAVDFVDDQVTLGSLFVVRSAQFNQPIADKDFAVPVEGGTTAAYFASQDEMFSQSVNGPRKRGFAIRINKPIDDARVLIPELRAGAQQLLAPQSSSPVTGPPRRPWGPLFVVNIAAICAFVAYLCARHWRRKS
jgi:hypothetical protein